MSHVTMTIVKICGLRTVEHALVALEAGADLLGFVFAPARRQVGPAEAAAIAAAVRAAPGGDRVGLVGVFVNEAAGRMREMASTCGLDALQLSGDESAALVGELGAGGSKPAIIKALRLTGGDAEQRWLEAGESLRLLVDAHVPGSYGGAGVVGDWARAAELARRRAILLAGGLHPGNVAAAITQVRPWGVDVSSGVETDGIKDAAKIQAFVAAVRAADQPQKPENRDWRLEIGTGQSPISNL
jgi:phosphoribosylanthranilate isomerase